MRKILATIAGLAVLATAPAAQARSPHRGHHHRPCHVVRLVSAIGEDRRAVICPPSFRPPDFSPCNPWHLGCAIVIG
jgi:hypothetical protein